MQLGVLVEVLCCESDGGGADWRPGARCDVLVKVLCEIDGRALRSIQWVLVEVLFCESDGRVLGGMQFGVLVEVLFCESWPGAKGIQFAVLVEVLFCESLPVLRE